jgi:hypothetical protein
MPQPVVLEGNEDLKPVLTAFINTWPLYTHRWELFQKR